MWPYYDQNVDAPFSFIFTQLEWPAAKWTASVGALLALATSLYALLFALPRIFYAMASDGLIYRFLGRVNKKTKTPVIATLLSGFIAAVLSAVFEMKQLADMMSIGVLLAYTLVGISVLLLRYSPGADSSSGMLPDLSVDFYPDAMTFKNFVRRVFNVHRQKTPTKLTKNLSISLIVMSTILVITIDALCVYGQNYLASKNVFVALTLGVCILSFVICIVALSRQPQSTGRDSFQVPLVPFVPFASITVNICLMINLPTPTWIRFSVWMVIGFFIYFTYGIFNSTGFLNSEQKDNQLKMKDIPK